MNIDITLSHII